MSAKVAFIGLGVMGFPMAGHLKARGYDVTVYNRTASKAEDWVKKHGGRAASTPAAAAQDQDFVMLMVGNDRDVEQVALGAEGALGAMKKGAVLVDHTTASADIARKVFAEARKRGVDFIDAPVSGGQAGAENGKLTVMCGGEPAAFDRAKPVMDSYGRAVTLLGPCGAGQLTKMVNQICIAGLVQALSEGIAFAEKAGLDVNTVLDVISKGAAQSWQMENRGRTMHERKFNFGFAVDWMRKDLGIAMAEAKRNGAKLPVTEIVDGYYADVQKMGGSRYDTSSLIIRL
ncbi:MAG TPA: NAD(P)-dependent oxidoreductase [Usitatibacter sp.]|jgi:3-hydroxyisobutyrate dehydrogenase-like beta-hydroxyacid dehydrogenase|nr:NAD(P)-dependent oxidoreductase [Usitatibacter sp.]